MFDHDLRIYAFLQGYVLQIAQDLDEAAMKTPAYPGGNPPTWIIGHLSMVSDFGLRLLGQETRLPRTWGVLFGPGSKPMEHLDRHPPKAELLEAYTQGHAALEAAVRAADPEKFSVPNPFQPLAGVLPTLGTMLAHLLTSHESFHVSQLSACRRAKGLPPLF